MRALVYKARRTSSRQLERPRTFHPRTSDLSQQGFTLAYLRCWFYGLFRLAYQHQENQISRQTTGEVSRVQAVSKVNSERLPRFKMAASSSKHVEEKDCEHFSGFEEFDSCVDEAEALADLEDLFLSDDEFFVEVDTGLDQKTNPDGKSECEETSPTPSLSLPPALCCSVCGKIYKRKVFLTRHEETCTNKKRKTFRPISQPGPSIPCGIEDMFKILNSANVITDALKKMEEDPVLSLVPGSPGSRKQELAKKLLHENWNTEPWQECAEKIVHPLLEAIVQGGRQKFSCSTTLTMLSSVSTLSVQLRPTFFNTVRQTQAVDEAVMNNTLQHLIDLLLPALSHFYYNETKKHGKTSSLDFPVIEVKQLSLEDKQVLHFVIGYTARKLRRKFQRCCTSNKAALMYLDMVKTWTIDPDKSTLAPSIQDWTLSLDRGGLLHCSSQFFNFMKVVEVGVRQHLNTKTIGQYAGQDVVPIIVGKLKSMTSVQSAFRTLVGHAINSEELCEGLLDEVLIAWVQCKARRVVENFLFELKTKNKGQTSRKGTPAMRKTLDKV